MDLLKSDILTLLLVLPLVGSVLVLVVRGHDAIRWTAIGAAAATFAVALLLPTLYESSGNAGDGAHAATAVYRIGVPGGVVQLVQRSSWIPSIGAQYFVGIDGISLPLVVMAAGIFLLAGIASWNIDKLPRAYFALLLALETAVLGVFVSLDLLLLFVFFELALVPMFFLIGVWGGPRREAAAIKFFIYTLVGSVALLIAIIGIYLVSRDASAGHGTFDLVALAGPALQARLAQHVGGTGGPLARTLFLLLLFGFLVKVPSFPLHTWLPEAHVEGPTPVSMVLAALMLKMGGYGLMRVAYPLFPAAAQMLWALPATLGVISILYGALCAMGQTDFKRLVAYSSVSHMGFVVLGIALMTPLSMNGALFMMVAHGVTSAALFFIVGVVYDRTHHRELSRLGGLLDVMPVYSGLAAIGILASLGLPGLCNFVGEAMVLFGAFGAAAGVGGMLVHGGASPLAIQTLAVLAALGIVLTAAYMIWTLQRVFFGPSRQEYRHLPDIDTRERLVLVPLAVAAVALGVLPNLLVLGGSGPSVAALLRLLGGA
jgi:NADH-quinone oxidoreductase subunit M